MKLLSAHTTDLFISNFLCSKRAHIGSVLEKFNKEHPKLIQEVLYSWFYEDDVTPESDTTLFRWLHRGIAFRASAALEGGESNKAITLLQLFKALNGSIQ